MVRQSSVGGSSKSSGSSSSSSSSARRCILIAVIVMVILFMLPGGGPNVDDNVRSGQAQHDSTGTVVHNTNNFDTPDDTDDMNDVADIEAELDVVRDDLEQAQQQELEKNKSALTAAIEITGSYVRSAFSKLLAKTDISEAEIEQMVEEVESKLEHETIGKLQEESDEMVNNLEDTIEGEAMDESDSGLTVEEIRSDIEENEQLAIREMNEEMEKKAEAMKQMMRKKAEQFEIEILEKRLGEKLHKQVKLVVVDDELTDVDHMLDGLSILTGGSTTAGGQSSGSAPVATSDGDDETTTNDDDTTTTNDDDAN